MPNGAVKTKVELWVDMHEGYGWGYKSIVVPSHIVHNLKWKSSPELGKVINIEKCVGGDILF